MDHLFLSNTLLFRGISPGEVKTMLTCLNAETRQYPAVLLSTTWGT